MMDSERWGWRGKRERGEAWEEGEWVTFNKVQQKTQGDRGSRSVSVLN
jgi:hypothetical protein